MKRPPTQHPQLIRWPAAVVAIGIVGAVALRPGAAQDTTPSPATATVQPVFDPLPGPQPATDIPHAPADVAVPGNEPFGQMFGVTTGRPGANLRDRGTSEDRATAFIELDPQPAETSMRRIQDQIRRAAAAIRSAPDELSKARETKLLSDLLNEFFEVDARRREVELAQIEERVKKLREQLDRRREKKQEIIDLQLKVALNEADGLGFFTGPAGPEPIRGYTLFGTAGSGSGAVYMPNDRPAGAQAQLDGADIPPPGLPPGGRRGGGARGGGGIGGGGRGGQGPQPQFPPR